jgi:hypothetical protein
MLESASAKFLVPSVVFPNKGKPICQLALHLATDPDVYLQQVPYKSVIKNYGGHRR